jgi:hypothetical protein
VWGFPHKSKKITVFRGKETEQKGVLENLNEQLRQS